MNEGTTMTRRAYRADEIAAMLGISRSEAYNLVREGHIRSIRIGRLVLVPVEALDEFLHSS